ncbi:fructose-1,6-bisphosphatase I [Methylomarinovum tepidoasis]|uniref:Fructose-1,6-bisphosphatase class 1 n=1 Tax=Methylomarinovum tepidoasis TaxID=2840183 RepID=A0AAU9CFL0_9GAMM|nr:class 1 fructose-bisphosphatase [Methylomarinovum sp. IN45]BCX89033.1 fructose-1,6-bisphosphatase I [Methylomarinovum sp. IN45]
MQGQGISLTEFLIQQQRKAAGATGELTLLISDIARACKAIAREVRYGALVGNLGQVGEENVQGEVQQKLDVLSNDIMIAILSRSGHVAAMASEENEDIIVVPKANRGKYLVCFDPLDGSSNININMCIGTIFSILRCPEGVDEPTEEHFLQPGTEQVASGFCVYGPSVTLVLTTGDGAYGFTLDQGVGEFFLTHPDIRIAEEAKEFAINMSNWRFWEPPVRRYIEECLQGKEGPLGRDYNMRWIASFVAEAYRILQRGGFWTYPLDEKLKKKGQAGRLRLMYEANPIGFIIEQAGGVVSTGRERVLTLQPTHIHQRVPLFIGARKDIETIEAYHREWDAQQQS